MCFNTAMPVSAPTIMKGAHNRSIFSDSMLISPRFALNGILKQFSSRKYQAPVPRRNGAEDSYEIILHKGA